MALSSILHKAWQKKEGYGSVIVAFYPAPDDNTTFEIVVPNVIRDELVELQNSLSATYREVNGIKNMALSVADEFKKLCNQIKASGN